MKTTFMFLTLIACMFGCSTTYVQRVNSKSETCYDFDSCQRDCKMYNNKQSCKDRRNFYK